MEKLPEEILAIIIVYVGNPLYFCRRVYNVSHMESVLAHLCSNRKVPFKFSTPYKRKVCYQRCLVYLRVNRELKISRVI